MLSDSPIPSIAAAPQTVALLDLGSNSLRMMIVRVGKDGACRMLDQA